MTIWRCCLGLLAAANLAACETRLEPAPVVFANDEVTTRTSRLFDAVTQFCITPLPEARELRAAIEPQSWEPLEEDDSETLSLFGYDGVVIARDGLLSGLVFQIRVYQGTQDNAQIVGCTITASDVDARALEQMLQQGGHIQGEPTVDMNFPPQRIRSWHLASAPPTTPPFGLAIEENVQDGSLLVSINQ